jgi:LuxR family transcriptional regulator, maltose regulon positive regulatory protein
MIRQSDLYKGLLKTKLNRPGVTRNFIDRLRLVKLLDNGIRRPLTIVIASAGFGKTTLVSSWVENLAESTNPPVPTAWLSLDKNDSDLVVFLRYVVAAIDSIFPESCAETLALLRTSQSLPPNSLVIALSNDIEKLPARFVLVLDDYYAIHNTEVHDFLSDLLRHWPEHLHLVLISRNNPPLPLGKLRASGQLSEIRTRDLRFSPDELAAFLDKASPSPLSASTISFIDERLEGWIAGMRLATLSLGSGGDAERELMDLSGSHLEIADYLMDEVLANQPPAILRFLLVTSILNRFCARLCESVLAGDSDFQPGKAAGHIQYLESSNLFLVPLDNNRQWYRYHHLFQDLLQRRLLAELSVEEVAELHRRTAAWFAGQGFIEEALRHALAIDDLNLAAQLVVAGLCDALNLDDRSTLERWLSLFPDAYIQRQPWLLILQAIVLQYIWQLPAVWKLLDQIEAMLDGGDESELPFVSVPQDLRVLRGIVASMRATQAFISGQADRAVAAGEEALALLPKQWQLVRGVAFSYWGFGMHALGQGDVARRALVDDYESLSDKSDAYALRLLFSAAFITIELGDLEQARLLAETLLDHAISRRLPVSIGHGHYLVGVVHYYRNELDAAEKHFEELVVKRLSAHTQTVRNAIILLARMYMARKEFSAALTVMDFLSQLDLDRLGKDGEDARSLRAQLALIQGDSAAAYRWAESYTAPAVGQSLLWLQAPHLAKAWILLERGADADILSALDILDALQSFAERSFNVYSQIEALALRAVALDKQKRTVDASAALQRAVELARPGGFIRVFVDLGSPMKTMLQTLAQKGLDVAWVHRILAAFPDRSPETLKSSEPDLVWSKIRVANAMLIEPLTNRELEVLLLLRNRLSNKEIAQQLSLSPLTVKRYTNDIYGKFGVNRRWDAVVRSEELGFFPQS